MAVEARHMNLFSPQLIANGDFIKSNQGNASIYSSAQMEYGNGLPFPATMPESLVPPPLLYQSQSFDCNLASAKTSMNKADSELTYYVPSQRKRSRDSINDEFNGYTVAPQKTNKLSGFPSFLHQDIAFQVQQQQSEIDRFLAQHAEKVRLELEEQRKRQSRILVSAIQEGIVKKLQEKDEVIQRMGKLNWVLQERVKSLCMENQIWRDLAQANEATANSLRSNLQQVLAHVSDDHRDMGEGGGTAATKAAAAVADDAESSCGSSDFGRCTLANEAVEGAGVKDKAEEGVQDKTTKAVVGNGNRMCRKCGGRESRVLLLPCRHLCLCTICGSTLRNCPLCHSLINASVHVNLS